MPTIAISDKGNVTIIPINAHAQSKIRFKILYIIFYTKNLKLLTCSLYLNQILYLACIYFAFPSLFSISNPARESLNDTI